MTTRRILQALLALALCATAAAQPRERTYDLQHVAYRLWFNEDQRTFDAQVTNTISPLADDLRAVWFDAQGLQIKGVTVNGVTVSFQHEGTRLSVDLPRAYDRGEKIDVLVRYGGKPTGGLYFVHERDAWPARSSMVYSKGEPEYNRQWLVTYDFPDDKATSECWIACKPGYTAVSNGVLLGVERNEKEWTYHWKMDQPHSTYLIAFAVADYEIEVEMLGDLPVEYYYPRGLADMGRASFAGTARMVDFFGKLTGVRYPYDRFSQLVVGDFVTGGMEHTTMVTNNISTLHATAEQPLASSTGLVAHELAHQWFGDLVTCATWSHMWLNEGFASLLPAFWARESEGQGEFELDRKGTVGSGYNASRGDRLPVVLQDYGADPDRMFRSPSYAGGGARMFMLIDVLGEDVFWRGVKHFLETHKFQPVTTDQFFAAMSESSGRDLKWFQDQWFHREGVPTVRATVEGRRVALAQDEKWTLDVPVWQFTGGRWAINSVRIKEGTASLDLPADGPVLIDPERRVMAQVSGAPAFPEGQALEAYRAAGSAAVRDALLGSLRNAGTTTLLLLMSEEPVATLRQRLAGLIARDDVQAQLRLVDDHDRRIAQQAVARLGAVGSTPEVIAKLRSVLENDTNPRIRFSALSSLYTLTNDESLVARAWATDSPNEAFKTFALDRWQRTDPDRVRRICLDTLRASTNTILRIDATRRLGTLKDAPGSSEVYEALVEIVRDHGSNQPRLAAANALAAYGNKAALEFLRPLASEGNTRFANAARGPIGRLERLP